MQGKGGVGKSFAAFLLAQYLPDKSVLVRCFDADPINNTLASFPALNAVKVDLIENSDKGRRIDPRRFDDLVEQITGQPAEAHVIVDKENDHLTSVIRSLPYSLQASALLQSHGGGVGITSDGGQVVVSCGDRKISFHLVRVLNPQNKGERATS